jgi:hypothetical protein
MNDGSAQAYLRSEATLRQPSQTNIRSAGCVPELRWSAKCFICAPQPLQTRVGTSCVSGARSSIANPSQKKPKPMNDRKTDSPLCNLSIFEENRHLREFPWPVRSVTRPGESLVQGSKITALRSWRCPRFCHGAVDDVALDSLASWARKRSQVLARQARLDRRQPHGRTTSGALRTLVLGIEHGLLLRNQRSPAAPGSPASQPAAVDLKGSDAMTLISTRLHLGHSNNRCSKPIGPGETRSSSILVWQCEQRRRSTAVKDCGDEGTMLPLHWAEENYRSSCRRYLPGRRRWSQSCPTHQRDAGQY